MQRKTALRIRGYDSRLSPLFAQALRGLERTQIPSFETLDTCGPKRVDNCWLSDSPWSQRQVPSLDYSKGLLSKLSCHGRPQTQTVTVTDWNQWCRRRMQNHWLTRLGKDLWQQSLRLQHAGRT